ncbi:thiamine pyrophosphate-dependent enzyme, probable carboxylase/decarboxylase/carboligase [Pseudomonas sp. GM49]|uniref:thiamine pyrophosphate-dependent enzyme n=1 Tax=Pseudomonas sp. GM49 TaxID=1144331 RepID=UPI00027081DD|nr:thiamine pyrophosphate-dependent enzyme [Pseudomonas sp. GM49]EJM69351.1 thiamine pyrophosphate-dependent enzyme, probable carboxylase/decarboxylase/carboligase [Pseudomonas sp. GM49]
MKLTGGQIVAKALKANGVDYVAGMPGDGSWALVEALLKTGSDIPFIQVIQEQSAVHLADGYFRACGRPMAVLLPAPLGLSKALGGIAVALADASAMLVISGGIPDHDDGWPEFTATGITKEHARVSSIEQLPQTLRQAFDTMFSGHIGPVSLDIPAAVQRASVDASLSPATLRANGAGDIPSLMVSRPVAQLRSVLEGDAILVVGTQTLQDIVGEMFPDFQHQGHFCTAGAGTVGWAVPAAIGAKLAMPARQVVCAVSDGDFLQSMQEMAVCVMHSLPVVFLVFNNSGSESLSDVQVSLARQPRAGEFNLPDGKPYSPDFAAIARNFGLEAWRVEHASQLNPAFIKALNSKGPSLVEIITARGSRVN